MAKTLEEIAFNPTQCRLEIGAFKKLLQSKEKLAERADILKFFKKRKQLSAFIGTFAPNIGLADRVAHEFPIIGDFAADIMLGNKDQGIFCAVEFEDGKPASVFTKVRNKSTTEWSRRFEHAFSQLVDWFYALDDFKKTDRFKKDFGHGHIRFLGLIVLGRSAGVSDDDRPRLRWRTEKVLIDSHPVECLTYDELCDQLEWRVSRYPEAFKLEE